MMLHGPTIPRLFQGRQADVAGAATLGAQLSLEPAHLSGHIPPPGVVFWGEAAISAGTGTPK
jgi:hypothetical protein